MIHELRVTDKEGVPVRLVAGTAVGITIDGSASYEGIVVSSDQGGVVGIEFDDEVYAAYCAERDSNRPAGRFRNHEVRGG
jgi:hypothetical protein